MYLGKTVPLLLLSFTLLFGSTDSITVIGDVKIVGVSDSTAKEFIRNFIPFESGDTITTTEFTRKIIHHNRVMNEKSDLFNEYRLMSYSLPNETTTRCIVKVSARKVSQYNGGGYWAYFGKSNRNFRGERWGIWLGYNKNGGHLEHYLSNHLYIGLKGEYRFESLQGTGNSTKTAAFLTHIRHIINPLSEFSISLGYRGYIVADENPYIDKPDYNSLAFDISYLLDFRHLRKRSVGTIISLNSKFDRVETSNESTVHLSLLS